jgi:hypothetical protein
MKIVIFNLAITKVCLLYQLVSDTSLKKKKEDPRRNY